jgi:flagellar biosynthetic protein FlhB
MARASAEDKTEKATPKKREDERKKGNVFQSADVVSALSIFVVFLALRLEFPYLYSYLYNFMHSYLSRAGIVATLDSLSSLDVIREFWFAILLTCAPVLIASLLAAVLATGIQTKFKISGEQIKFKFSNISLFQGFKRLFSLRSIVELIKSIIKTIAIGYIMYLQIKKVFESCASMMSNDIDQSCLQIVNDIMDMVIQMTLVFLAIAAADYFYQWWDYERRLRMTKEEIKNEAKQAEGDPQIKGKIREQQRSIARMRMMQKVPEADVVIKNPTHYAVAIKYDPENKKQKAPIVVAKGKGYIALKIIAIAEDNKVTVTENRPLARALYQSVKVGREIPGQFYQAVAEVLAFVYNLKKRERLYEIQK